MLSVKRLRPANSPQTFHNLKQPINFSPSNIWMPSAGAHLSGASVTYLNSGRRNLDLSNTTSCQKDICHNQLAEEIALGDGSHDYTITRAAWPVAAERQLPTLELAGLNAAQICLQATARTHRHAPQCLTASACTPTTRSRGRVRHVALVWR